MTETRALPPLPDEAEVSIFGPGVGECIVVHLGHGAWMVVDSCLEEGEPIALRYLRRLGVSPTAITDVVVTHWHNDHIGGAAKVLEASPNARLTCSGALNCEEFQRVWTSQGAVGLGRFDTVVDVCDSLSREMGPEGVEAVTGVDCSQVQDAA